MNIAEVFDDYVAEVLRQLPDAMRADIGVELRALLDDALTERATERGLTPDYALALSVLGDFGTPKDLAARYLPDVRPLLSGAESGPFLRLALGGVAVQWMMTLPGAIGSGSLAAWWFSRGLGAFWWPGVLVIGAAARNALRQRRGIAALADQRVDRERVEPRATRVAAGVTIVAALVVLLLPWWRLLLPAAAAAALDLAPEFARGRGWLAVPLWAAVVWLRVQAARTGRWTSALRRWRSVTDAAGAALLTWWSLGHAVLRDPSNDAFVKALFQVIAVLVLIELALQMRRRPRPRPSPITRS